MSDLPETEQLFCYRHPDVETGLRCNRCGKPICAKCARRTPVGFRCPDCIREQEDKFYTGTPVDYLIAVGIALPLSLVAAVVFTYILGGFGFFIILINLFAAPFAGGLIAEAVRWGVRRRRSRYLAHVVAGMLALATVLVSLPILVVMFLGGGGLFALLSPGMLIVLGGSTIMARLR